MPLEPEVIEKIRLAWNSGESGLTIAKRLHTTRNVIIGLVNRRRKAEGSEKWRSRQSTSGEEGAATRKAIQRAAKPRVKPELRPPRRTPRTKTRPPPSLPKPPRPLSNPILWNDKRPNQCSFIADEPSEVHIEALECCGAPVVNDGSWCSYHRSVVYRPDSRLTGKAQAGHR